MQVHIDMLATKSHGLEKLGKEVCLVDEEMLLSLIF